MQVDEITVRIEYGTKNSVFIDAYSVRVAVFVDEQRIPLKNERDKYDETAYHCVVYVGAIPAACGRLNIYDSNVAKICRIATSKTFRRSGLASRVCKSLIDLAYSTSANIIFLNAQVSVIELYKRLGFVLEGEIFDEENIPHIKMILRKT